MTRNLAKSLVALGLISGVVCARAQNKDPLPPNGWSYCFTWATPYSPVYIFNTRADILFRVSDGSTGSVSYWGPPFKAGNPPSGSKCPVHTAVTNNIKGRIGFASGPLGSIQDDNANAAIDNDMQYTLGMPTDMSGNWSYATTVRKDPTTNAITSSLFGKAIVGKFFEGASGRYMIVENSADNIDTLVRIDVLGDGSRIRWQMTNLAATAQDLGLWYGAQIGILPVALGEPADWLNDTGFLGDPTFITFPGHKPLLVDGRFTRANDPTNFPPYVQFCYGQTNAYGLQVDLGPTDATTDSNGNSDSTQVDELVVGSAPFVVGDPFAAADTDTMPDFIFGDASLSSEQFIIKYQPDTAGPILPNASRVIVSYFRDTWGNSKYIRTDIDGNPLNNQPYSTVVDAPHILVQDDAGTGTNGLGNNPFVIRVYADNNGGYSKVYTGVDINDVTFHLTLPAGLSLINGDGPVKTLFTVHPQDLDFVEFHVQSDGVVVGDLPYTVTITSTPGPTDTSPITHNGVIRVSATKQIPLVPSANLISAPWVFSDSSWEAVLQMSTPSDFTAYNWDPQQNSYVVSTNAQRGVGTWFILNPATHPNPEVDPYHGASSPTDMQTGAPNLQLRSGWNLIGDPYPYALPVSQLVGVSASNPAHSFSFAQLVSQGIVSPYLALWDPSVNNYRYVQGIVAMMQPNRGYWVQVLTAQDLTLNYPPIWDTFVPGGKAAGSVWTQSAGHWRLNLQAKTNHGQSVDNYVGVATGSGQAKSLQAPMPPQGPTQDLMVSFDGTMAGRPTRMAQTFSDHTGTQQWTMSVQSKSGDYVTLSWPNLSTLPSNMGFWLVDAQSQQSFDMRSRTSVMYRADANMPRRFLVQTSTSGTLPTIGSVSTTAGRISGPVPATGTFGLNYDATVTVSILNSQNNVVAVLLNNKSLSKGNNQVSWNLKNQNGSYVAAGNYQLAIAATVDGNTARKVASVAVTR